MVEVVTHITGHMVSTVTTHTICMAEMALQTDHHLDENISARCVLRWGRFVEIYFFYFFALDYVISIFYIFFSLIYVFDSYCIYNLFTTYIFSLTILQSCVVIIRFAVDKYLE